MKNTILRFIYKLLRKSPANMEMVSYWKTKDAVQARVRKTKEGNIVMDLEGEKYPVVSYPRGHILYGKMSKIKHEIKNQVFNDSYWKLEKGEPKEKVIKEAKKALFDSCLPLMGELKYDLVPYIRLCPSVKEIYRAWTVLK